jgi:hypothetical protein
MPKEYIDDFPGLIDDVYGPILQEFDFQLVEENNYLVRAQKEGIELIFSLESTYLFHDLSLEIRLFDKLGEMATSVMEYRHLGVTTIAECLDPDFKDRIKKAQTKEEIKEILVKDKITLLKYCQEFLASDVSSWSKVVESLERKRKKFSGAA